MPAIGMIVAVCVVIASRRHAPALREADDNPNKFFLCATGREFSVRYTYDPHAADLWMFRTAEGKLRLRTNE